MDSAVTFRYITTHTQCAMHRSNGDFLADERYPLAGRRRRLKTTQAANEQSLRSGGVSLRNLRVRGDISAYRVRARRDY
ncbi:unnamed protein product [Nippostrongylus brasiliensis]|uniref:DUF1534 domain-containing protein n=1 Tax=Nippostrongylus brasiliensis TaxID=27835 RepID=A0A0N4XXV2_NIPBR|nr:unnamed protein product [Nippostrongylus brasiliensis]